MLLARFQPHFLHTDAAARVNDYSDVLELAVLVGHEKDRDVFIDGVGSFMGGLIHQWLR